MSEAHLCVVRSAVVVMCPSRHSRETVSDPNPDTQTSHPGGGLRVSLGGGVHMAAVLLVTAVEQTRHI